MDNFYRIKKYGDCFQINRKHYYFPRLKLSRIEYDNVFQYRHAIIAKHVTGGYDFYLPSTKYDSSLHECTVIDRPLTLVASNISEYLTYHDIFVFKKDSDWVFLLLHNFEMELEVGDDIANSLEKRLAELPRIPCEANTPGYFKNEFENLYRNPFVGDKIAERHHLAIFHTDQDYCLNIVKYKAPLSTSGIIIMGLGLVTKLPGGDGHFFKGICDKGETWFHHYYYDSITYGSIDPMKETEYPATYPSKDFFGYWKKNHDDLILGLAFLSNFDSTSFVLHLPCAAKKVQFVKSINRVDLYDGSHLFKPATLWKITSATDEISFLMTSVDHYAILSLEDFTN